MTIAIHIPAGKNKYTRENFNFRCFSLMAVQQPADHFIFIFDSPPEPELYLEPNCTPVILTPRLKNNLLRHYWYNYKIPALLQKYNAGVFVTAANMCSLRTPIPQCMIMQEMFISLKRPGYLKKYFPAFLRTAKLLCVTNIIFEEVLMHTFKIKSDKLLTLYPGLPDHDHASTENDLVKDKYTGGNNFFYYEADKEGIDHLVIILKAFSLFKKWQRSAMQLLILVKTTPEPGILKLLKSYKYRNEVRFIDDSKLADLILPAAYAAIVITGKNLFPMQGLIAMRYDVPVISVKNDTTIKIFKDAALYAELNEKDLSEKLMLLYKDEYFRNAQISKGKQLTEKYSWPESAILLHDKLQEIAI